MTKQTLAHSHSHPHSLTHQHTHIHTHTYTNIHAHTHTLTLMLMFMLTMLLHYLRSIGISIMIVAKSPRKNRNCIADVRLPNVIMAPLHEKQKALKRREAAAITFCVVLISL